jgi:hypothetical protein
MTFVQFFTAKITPLPGSYSGRNGISKKMVKGICRNVFQSEAELLSQPR